MRVTVKLFARARELARADEVSVDLPTGATVGALREALATAYPALAGLLRRSALAVDAEFAQDGDEIREGADVAVVPPVSGG